jgi:hypothetical protein
MSHFRHNCTNYDELIKDLKRDGVQSRIYYWVIRDRITELLEVAIDQMGEEGEEGEEDR